MKRRLRVVVTALALVLAISGEAGAQTPGAPTITSVTAGDGSLAVVWSAPGGSTVTSYNLRYIKTDEDETVDANWTVETGIWTSGALEYTLTGLDGDISYDVQVQAANDEGSGAWSATSVGTPGIGAPSIDSVIVGDGALTVSWSEPPHAAQAVIASYDLRYIETSADETVDANWTVEQGVWTGGARIHVLDGLTNGTGYDVQVRAVTSDPAGWSATSTGTPAEHGGTRADATDLSLGTRVGGSIDPGADVDYFKFVLAGQTGVLIFTEGDLDTVGELQRSDGTVIERNDDSYFSHGIRNFGIWESLSAGTYYIKVTSSGGATGAYVLHAQGIPDSTATSRRTITLGDHVNGFIDPAGDTDWYTFTLAEQTKVIVQGSSTIFGELQDSRSEPVAVQSFGVPGTGFVHQATLPAGSYNISIAGDLPTTEGLYSLRLLEASEPGSTRQTAIPLRFYRVQTGTIDPTTDADYFRIEVDEATDVRLWGVGTGVVVTGEILDSAGNAVSGASVFGTGNGFAVIHEFSAGTHYLRVTRQSGSETGSYAVMLIEDVLYRDFRARCSIITLSHSTANVNDPLYGCQWHLHNEGQRKGTADEDINVEEAWGTATGSGVNVAVVDDGLQSNHPDLTDNVDTSKNHDYVGGGDIYSPFANHGTQVAGIIAARDNTLGMRGVAPRATIYGYNYLRTLSDVDEADAMTRNMSDTAVSNNSWGPLGIPGPERATEIWKRAVQSGVTQGFGGRGVFYVFAGGNDTEFGEYSTLNEYTSHYAVTAVCAVNDLGRRTTYSEMGANLWVCGPSSDNSRGRAGIATTDNLGRYTNSFGGTSAAAPQVSGVAALVHSVDRGTKPGLSWRDVKLILAASARKNDPANTGWETGALKYGADTSDPEYYQFNHSYGFGVVDAKAAVDLAADWFNVPAMLKTEPPADSTAVSIPTGGSTVSRTVTVESEIEFTEFVEVTTDWDARDFRNLQVELVSPSGAVSVLSIPETGRCHDVQRPGITYCTAMGSYSLGSARHLGEDPSGTWTLRMRDTVPGGWANRLNSWSIAIYGHRSTPGAPTLNHVDPGTNDLTVSWSPPANIGSSAITSYDVRYIRSDARNKGNDSAWTLIEGDANAATTSHTITPLEDTIRRDVQVRAVNDRGAGDWSVTARGTPGATNSEPFFVDGEETVRTVDETETVGAAIGAPVEARDAEGDTLSYTLGGSDASHFSIDAASGQLQVMDLLDYETDDSYDLRIMVRDSKDDAGSPDTDDDASIAVKVVVEDVNEAPELMGNTEPNYAENGDDEVIEYTATDPEGKMVTWMLSGTDQHSFVFNDGTLEFSSPPDFERPTDADGQNDYEIVVTVSDGVRSRDVPITVTVDDVNEPFMLEGDSAYDHNEGALDTITFRVVDDPENGPIDWELTGTDRLDFGLQDGGLFFAVVPNHERPADSNRDNRYHVTVTADDGANRKSLAVTVTVIDVDEPGEVRLSARQPQVGTALTATLEDPDRGVTGLTWSWHSSPNGSDTWTEITGAGSRSYTPQDTDLGRYLRATASYRDTHGTGKVESAVSRNPVQAAPPVNTAPEFPATEDGMRSVDENTFLANATGHLVGNPVTAEDPGDTLTYTLSGSHAPFFTIDSGSGQLRTNAVLDYESRSSYSVTVTATDPSNLADSIRVTINVINIEETGTVTFSTDFPQVGRSVTATVNDPDRGVSAVAWEWRRAFSEFDHGVLIDGANSNRYTPVEDDIGNHLRVIARYTDRHQPQFEDNAEAATVGSVTEPLRTSPRPSPSGPSPGGPSPGGPSPGGPSPGNGGGGGGGGGGDGAVEEAPPGASDFFTDVRAGVWYESAVTWMIENKITHGCTPTTFCPDANLTRQQFVTFLWRAGGRPTAEYTGSQAFADVTEGVYSDRAIGWAVANGVTRGCTAGIFGDGSWQFCPTRQVSRGEMATLLYRHVEAAYVGAQPHFTDVPAGAFYTAAITWLNDFAVVPGCDLRLWCPNRAATRAEAALFINGVAIRPHLWGEGNTSFTPQRQ